MLDLNLCEQRLRMARTWLTDVAQVTHDGAVDVAMRSRHVHQHWRGAIRGEYAVATGQWGFFCPVWHTGQAVKALVMAADALGDDNLDSAMLGAQFILDNRVIDGDDRGLILAYEDEPNKVNTSAILECVDGLFVLGRRTEDRRYTDAALQAVDWVQRKAVIAGKGLLRDVYDPVAKQFEDHPYGVEGRPLLDDAAFLTAYHLTDRGAYLQTATQIAERLLADESPPGNWLRYPPCNRSHGQIHPRHAYWWGRPMLAMHLYLQQTIHPTSVDDRYRNLFERSCDWYCRAMRKDGGLFRNTYADFSTDSFGHATSGVAAAVLMFIDRYLVLRDASMPSWIERGLTYCMNMQFTEPNDANLAGCILEKVRAPDGTDASPYHIRDLGTIFFVQAMAAWLQGSKTQPQADGDAVFERSQSDVPAMPAPDDIQVHAGVRLLPIWFTGATTVLENNRLLMLDAGHVCLSDDDGQTWRKKPIWPGSNPKDSKHSIIIRCRSGTLVFIFLDIDHQHLDWDNEKHALKSKPQLDVYAARSVDGGTTWSEPIVVFEGYCGCLINIIQTRGGRLVVPVQAMLDNPGRHAQTTCVSDDEGMTWKQSNLIDLGGHGHHDGCFEGAVTQLDDGRLWMLLRTNLDRFWQAWSEDEGLSWRSVLPTNIDASSAPANLLRLQSGRLMMVWNRLYPTGLTEQQQAEWERAGGDRNACSVCSSWHRRELSIAFSNDDGRQWTTPLVLARGDHVGYSHVFERRPGEIWLATQFGPRVSLAFSETELYAAAEADTALEGFGV